MGAFFEERKMAGPMKSARFARAIGIFEGNTCPGVLTDEWADLGKTVVFAPFGFLRKPLRIGDRVEGMGALTSVRLGGDPDADGEELLALFLKGDA